MRDPIIKTCSMCGRTFTRLEWTALRYVGRFDLADLGEHLELRDCTACLSTLSIESPIDSQLPTKKEVSS